MFDMPVAVIPKKFKTSPEKEAEGKVPPMAVRGAITSLRYLGLKLLVRVSNILVPFLKLSMKVHHVRAEISRRSPLSPICHASTSHITLHRHDCCNSGTWGSLSNITISRAIALHYDILGLTKQTLAI
jgi:hypothetical protein